MTEEISRAKAIVLAVYPHAFPVCVDDKGRCWIAERTCGAAISSTMDTEDHAWIDAASRLPAEPKAEPVGRDEARVCPTCILVNGLHHLGCPTARDYWNQKKAKDVEGGGVEQTVDPAVKLLADVMHLWIDGYVCKAPNSAVPDSVTLVTFDAIEKFLGTKYISVDYCGWNLNGETKEAAPEAARPSLAEEIIRRVVENTVRNMWTRNIELLEDDADAEFPTEEELVIDALGLALGEDTGCLDERDDDFRERVDLLWLEDKLRSQVPEPATEGAPETTDEEDENLTDEVCPNCGEVGVGYGAFCHNTGLPWPEVKAEGAEKVYLVRPTPLPTFNSGQLSYPTIPVDAYMDALESRNAELKIQLDIARREWQFNADDAVKAEREVERTRHREDVNIQVANENFARAEKAEREVDRMKRELDDLKTANVDAKFREGYCEAPARAMVEGMPKPGVSDNFIQSRIYWGRAEGTGDVGIYEELQAWRAWAAGRVGK